MTDVVRRRLVLGALGAVAVGSGAAHAADDAARETAARAIARGIAYLLAQQGSDGAWEGHVGITAVTLPGLMRAASHTEATSHAVARGLAYVERWAQPDGGIHQDDVRHYATAVSVLALVASGEQRYRDRIAAARDYLLRLQAREDNGFPPSHPLHGGTLVADGEANLDGTFFASRALAEAGLAQSHPYWARTLRFTSRCQNWKATNDQPWAATDGGFVFAPGFSFAGGTTSYGTMTYAGLSLYLDAGLPRTDARVEAALGWVRRHFTVDENPGLAKQTLYHSYFYLASTLGRFRVDGFADASGRARTWRPELVAALTARQGTDGSWANTEDPRWWESRPVLATAFAVRALAKAVENTGGPRRASQAPRALARAPGGRFDDTAR